MRTKKWRELSRREKLTRVAGFLIGFAMVWFITGCSEMQSDAPEPTPDNIVNGRNTQVIRMPDGFRNVAFTCYGQNGIYVTSRGWVQASADKNIVPLPSDIAVVTNDPQCQR